MLQEHICEQLTAAGMDTLDMAHVQNAAYFPFHCYTAQGMSSRLDSPVQHQTGTVCQCTGAVLFTEQTVVEGLHLPGHKRLHESNVVSPGPGIPFSSLN